MSERQLPIIDLQALRHLGPIDPQTCKHTAVNRAHILAQNRLLRAAYDKLRRNPDRRADFEEMAEALTGRVVVNKKHIEDALKIVGG